MTLLGPSNGGHSPGTDLPVASIWRFEIKKSRFKLFRSPIGSNLNFFTFRFCSLANHAITMAERRFCQKLRIREKFAETDLWRIARFVSAFCTLNFGVGIQTLEAFRKASPYRANIVLSPFKLLQRTKTQTAVSPKARLINEMHLWTAFTNRIYELHITHNEQWVIFFQILITNSKPPNRFQRFHQWNLLAISLRFACLPRWYHRDGFRLESF